MHSPKPLVVDNPGLLCQDCSARYFDGSYQEQ